jgi:hypothetical protein
MYHNLINITGCANATDTLECLCYAPYDIVNNFFNTSANGNTIPTLLDPIVDGDIIARWSSEQLKKGTFVHVPTIDGTNTDEGISFSLCGINTVEDFAGNISSTDSFQYIPSEYVSDLLAHYPNTPEYWIPPVGEIGLNYLSS